MEYQVFVECPDCNALTDVFNIKEHELIKCWNCEIMLELIEGVLEVANE